MNKDKMFSFKDIKDTYQLDKLNEKSKVLIKITDAIKPQKIWRHEFRQKILNNILQTSGYLNL